MGGPSPEPDQQSSGRGNWLMLLVVMLAVGLVAANPQVRGKALDLLFGAEEEFEYSSITDPPAEPHSAAS